MTIDSEVDEILDVAITQAVLCGLEVDGAFDELTIRKEAYGKITNLIAQEANKARIDELERMPSPAYIGSDGIRLELIAEYKNHRKAQLTADKEQAECGLL